MQVRLITEVLDPFMGVNHVENTQTESIIARLLTRTLCDEHLRSVLGTVTFLPPDDSILQLCEDSCLSVVYSFLEDPVPQQ